MISRRHRFHGYNSLRHVYREGKMSRGPQFGVKANLNTRRRTYRVAVVISRKINKSAVARNRMRRRLYALVQEADPKIAQPFDIVITVFQNSLLECPQAEIRSQLYKQLKETGVISGK